MRPIHDGAPRFPALLNSLLGLKGRIVAVIAGAPETLRKTRGRPIGSAREAGDAARLARLVEDIPHLRRQFVTGWNTEDGVLDWGLEQVASY